MKLLQLNKIFKPFILLYNYRRLLFRTTITDLKSRYAGTVIGLAWLGIYPFLFLALYAVVYIAIFKVRFGDMKPFAYVLLIFAGLIPFLNFIEVLSNGVGAVTENRNLIKNTLFPIELMPAKSVFISLPSLLISFCILEFTLILSGKIFFAHFFCLFIIFIQILFCLGLCWILSALNVFLKDLKQIIPLTSLALMLISPIAYTTDMIPDRLIHYLYFNPLFFLIKLYRECLLNGHIALKELAIFTIIAFSVFYVGYHFFISFKKVFADEC